ncbi:sporulation integral membrane protein YtvI [Thermoactinomyces intermedius]|jgi:sporulation integral membrane protein YtvI|uniref:Sporulation integral membrane protein YtvI n=1 Tax=Thermoactinomyces intermedius TaxID=2024 RepID=A0A8I1ACU8_THEIN|nr:MULTISPECIES: sporulation integral membrane protein YtvI [Thermoactinomyces]MBA4549441.1 sporulation integral membrane protein YtvI [Thermoactinomyces intermedius]MBA4836874.1 sporulation integral membrane protein YtvI [Thermoactinomyces intermedius]MBH8594805.1 sporulation integral membrane protein YtvI [Thermoactinomyces intermedius]MBH8602284.1 sporulation integral membrane protein YtvI [Thermoactinomyces sp. CICC 23799]
MVYPKWMGIILRSLLVAGILLGTYLLVSVTMPLVYPFVIGWLIAMFIEPMVRWLNKRAKIPRWAGVTLILLLLLSLLLTLIIFLVAEIVVELTKLADFLPVIFNKIGQTFVQTFTKENTDFRRIIDTVQTYLEKNPEHEQRISQSIQENIGVIADKGSEFITGILVAIGQFISNLPYLITVLVFITLAALFIGWDWPRLRKKILWVIPVDIQKTIRSILTDLKKALLGFVRAQLALVTITAVIMLVGLTILKIPYAFTIAFIIGLVDLLPYLGVGAVLVPWIIYLFLTGNLQWAIGLSITYGIIITVRQFLEPKLVASSIGIDPLLTLISLFVGLKLFGIIGLILGPVTVVILMALHRARVFQDIWKYILGHEPPVLRQKKD